MKWFKHMSDSWEDEKLSFVVDQAGLEGYGFWWRMVEIVASKVDENNTTLVTFSIKKWCSLFVLRPQKLRRLLTLCEDCGMFKAVLTGDMITVDIPNILKYRDEWSRKQSGKKAKTPESLLSKEEDTDIEEDNNTPHSPPEGETDSDAVQATSPSSVPACGKASKSPPSGNTALELKQAMSGYADSKPLFDALENFRVMRERIRKPMTGHALHLIFLELNKLAGRDSGKKIAILEQSIMNSWQGVFPLKVPEQRTTPTLDDLFRERGLTQ